MQSCKKKMITCTPLGRQPKWLQLILPASVGGKAASQQAGPAACASSQPSAIKHIPSTFALLPSCVKTPEGKCCQHFVQILQRKLQLWQLEADNRQIPGMVLLRHDVTREAHRPCRLMARGRSTVLKHRQAPEPAGRGWRHTSLPPASALQTPTGELGDPRSLGPSTVQLRQQLCAATARAPLPARPPCARALAAHGAAPQTEESWVSHTLSPCTAYLPDRAKDRVPWDPASARNNF